MVRLEICANSVQSSINAQEGGAYRVELCDNMWEGGTTSSAATIQLSRKYLTSTLLNVLIRPRGGDFCYSDMEFETIKHDIILSKQWGVDGIVCGVLNADYTIDSVRTKELLELSRPLPFTFHRAFDVCVDLDTALDILVEMGVDRVLTSGGANTVKVGLSALKRLNIRANGRIIIMPGGGVNDENIRELMDTTGCTEFHCSAKRRKMSTMDKTKWNGVQMNSSKDIAEDSTWESCVDQIRAVKEAARGAD
eukprot:CFRG0292T1